MYNYIGFLVFGNILFLVFLYGYKVDKIRKKSYNHGLMDAHMKVQDTMWYMNKYPMIYNTLFLISHNIKHGFVNWTLREDIHKLGDKLIHEHTPEMQREVLHDYKQSTEI